MSPFIDNLKGLGPVRLATLGGALLIILGLMVWLAVSVTRPGMALLYGGLEPAVAGEVVRQLEELGVAHEVQGDTILVESSERDRVRMALAESGLPRRGQAGYELLDRLGRFGTTTEMFNAAYWRAKEGELARTIDWLSNVRDARVHLVPLAREPFSRTSVEPSASITVMTEDGAPLRRRQAQAIRHLVALGVKGLDPERVTVIDAAAGVILGPEQEFAAAATQGLQAERQRRLQAEIEEMLAAHVGQGRVRVGVAVELDHEAETVTERIFDPETQVAVHRDITEIEETSSEAEGADPVSVAGNLPETEPAAGSSQSAQSARTESREATNYEISEVRRERQKPAGSVKRISVAVLLGGVWEASADGARTWRPQSETELAAIRNLVQSAIGFDEARGDRVTVESLPLQAAAGTSASDVAPGLAAMLLAQLPTLIQALALVAVAFLAIWFVVRPILRTEHGTTAGGARPALTASANPSSLEDARAEQAAIPHAAASAADGSAGPLPASVAEAEGTPHERTVVALVDAVDRHPEDALRTLRHWLKAGASEQEAFG